MRSGEAVKAAKALGAFYTPASLTGPLCRTAIRTAADSVFDPSCGDGAFLAEAVSRLLDLGADPRRLPDQIAGVEIDPAAFARANGALLSRHPSLRWSRIVRGNFFDFAEEHAGRVRFDAVLGNPPYIRYQRFADRDRAGELAARAGIRLSREAASWAPFVAVASTFVAPGGRMAFVLPREAQFVNYAAPLMEFLRARFGQLSFTPVPGRPFQALVRVGLLEAEDVPARRAPAVKKKVDSLLFRHCVRLSDVARVRLGIVTGEKRFFVIPRDDCRGVRLFRHLVPVVSASSQMKGLRVTTEETALLLRVREIPDAALKRYLSEGVSDGVPARYKCRIRTPWYAVPEQEPPDAFLTYLTGDIPRMAVNLAGARATNNVHTVRWSGDALLWTLAFHNWATLLSVERLGRVYGGGVLKIEPGDAFRIFVPRPVARLRSLADRADRRLRNGDWESVVDEVSLLLFPPCLLRSARAEWKSLRAAR